MQIQQLIDAEATSRQDLNRTREDLEDLGDEDDLLEEQREELVSLNRRSKQTR